MRFKEAKLIEEDWKSCVNKNGVLNIEKYSRIEHKRALEQNLTNIKDFEAYDSLQRTLGRSWM